MRVVILGAKPPERRTTEGDIVYFCNGSAGRVDEFPNSLLRIHVASQYIFGIETRQDPSLQVRVKMIEGRTFDRTVIQYRDDHSLDPGCLSRLSYKTKNIELVDKKEFSKIVRSSCGLRHPSQFFLKIKCDPKRKILSIINRYLLNRKEKSLFRPSTGVFALLVAIRDFGSYPEYVISCIGFKDGYIFDDKVYSAPRGHVEADKMVFKALSKSGLDIKTDVMEIHENFGFPIVN